MVVLVDSEFFGDEDQEVTMLVFGKQRRMFTGKHKLLIESTN